MILKYSHEIKNLWYEWQFTCMIVYLFYVIAYDLKNLGYLSHMISFMSNDITVTDEMALVGGDTRQPLLLHRLRHCQYTAD